LRYSVLTFGCRVNQADSQALEHELRRAGASPALPDHADVVVVNTCSVTASADQAARQAIRRVARDNPGVRVVVTGCYATRCAGDVAALPGVVAVVPNPAKDTLARDVLVPMMTSAGRYGEGDGPCGEPIRPGDTGRTCWTMRVQTGCEEACSYCIIPTTRGPSRSREADALAEELGSAARQGYREVWVTGVHLGSWGRDLRGGQTLASLLARLARDAGRLGLRLRVSSLEPMDCTPAVVDVVEGEPAIVAHLHLPLQHASDRVLRAMRRPYTLAQYEALVAAVRARLPGCAIGTDVIVGFPGETEDDARRLAAWLESSPLTHLHVFPYSDRPGTDAERLPGKVHGADVRARAELVRAAGRRLTTRFLESQVGAIRPALTLDTGQVALTDNYMKVTIARGLGRNVAVDVRIMSAQPLAGDVVAVTAGLSVAHCCR
jgi:threonylcarbamoyladenosine tRNA methylthiotransferase MtaB